MLVSAETPSSSDIVINVKDKGAKGNGVCDDRTFIQAAIDEAKSVGGIVFFPPGTYMVTRSPGTNRCLLITGNNVILCGVKGRSVIKQFKHVRVATPPPCPPDQPPVMEDPCAPDPCAADIRPMQPCILIQISNGKNVSIRDLELNGNWGNAQTTISAASDGATLPQSTINVASTDGFPVACPGKPLPTFELITPTGPQLISYTGMTPTSFTGCMGGSGTLRGDGDQGRIGYTVGRRSPANTDVTRPSNGHVLPQETIDVGSTIAFPPAGQLVIVSSSGIQQVTYTGKTSNTFTGCSGGTGTLSDGTSRLPDNTRFTSFVWSPDNGINQCTQRNPMNHLVFCHAERPPRPNVVDNPGDDVGIELLGVDFRQAYGDGLWIGGDGIGGGESGAIGGSRRVTVRDCTFDMCARNGISLIYADGVVIDNCSFRNIVTTAIDTEPERHQMRNVRIRDCSMRLWWNHWIDPTKNVLSIQGGEARIPSEWNYAQGYRVEGCEIHGSVLITDAVDVVLSGNTILCDFDSRSGSPIFMEMFLDDVHIMDNWFYARSGATAVIEARRFSFLPPQPPGTPPLPAPQPPRRVAVTQPAAVSIQNNAIHARNGLDGVFVLTPGGGPGFAGTASSVTALSLTQIEAVWTIDQFAGHQVVCGGVVATVESNDAHTLTLATWHRDMVHGWLNARAEPQDTPPPGPFTIQPAGGVFEVVGNAIDCAASDGRAAGRYGVHLRVEQVPGAPFNDARVRIADNKVRSANPHGVHVFLLGPPPIKYLEVVNNHAFDDQPNPTCTDGVFFDRGTRLFDPVSQVLQLVVKDNEVEAPIKNAVSGLTQGYWLEDDGQRKQFAGFGSPLGVVPAPTGSSFFRLDGGAGSTVYVKEDGHLPLDATHKTDRIGSMLRRDQTLVLDAVTTTSDNCLVVQAVVSALGGGDAIWDQWTNLKLDHYVQIVQDLNSNRSNAGAFAAAAGVLRTAGSSGEGLVRAHGESFEFGNGTYSFALQPLPPTPSMPSTPPTWVANGAKKQATTGVVSPPWPAATQEDDVGIMLVVVSDQDTGVTVSDSRWRELPGSPVLGRFNVSTGVKLHLFGARAFRPTMPAPTVSHGGPQIMAEILLFRGAGLGSTSGWSALGESVQAFTYLVTGIEPDLTALTIRLPFARADASYVVTVQPQGLASTAAFDVPTASKTPSQFTLIATRALTRGEQLAFLVASLT